MAWLERRRSEEGKIRYRLRERFGADKITVIKDLGIWRANAEEWKVKFTTAVKAGFKFTAPIEVAVIDAFLKAKAEGINLPNEMRRLSIVEMCDIYDEKCGPDFKGFGSKDSRSAYNHLRRRLERLKIKWTEKYADEITKFDVRDLLSGYSVGTRMRMIGAYGAMFRRFYEWQEEGNILPWKVLMPPYNPFSKFRKELKPAQKKELPDTRVLSPEEWARFRQYLTPRARVICEMALRRFLRMADIKAINVNSMVNGQIRGIQEKTGFEYNVPAMNNHPKRYDFTNFRKEFQEAQKKSGLFYAEGHPLHFSLKDLRRTGATWAYRKTKDLAGISAMLGHQEISTTQRYLNIDTADRETIARAVDDLFGGEDVIREVI